MLKLSGGCLLASFPTFLIYKKFSKNQNYKKNNFLNSEEFLNLKKNSNFDKLKLYDSKFSDSKEKVLIVGSGIIGLSTAYYLLKSNKYHVTLVDKNELPCNQTSYANACSMILSFSDPWVNTDAFYEIYNGIFKKDNALHFYRNLLFEYNVVEWALNAIRATFQNYFQASKIKNLNLSLLTREELRSFLSYEDVNQELIGYSQVDHLMLYNNMDSKPDAIITSHDLSFNSKGKFKYTILENKEEILKSYPDLKGIGEEFKGFAVKSYNEMAVDTNKLGKKILEACEKNKNFEYVPSTYIEEFVFENEIIKGINTSKGVILADKIVLCTGVATKHILRNLGYSFPLVSAKGHSMTFEVPEGKQNLTYNVHSMEPGVMMTQIGSKYRLGGLCDFHGENYEQIPKRIEALKTDAKRLLDYDEKKDKASFWVGLRPFLADDVPVISQLNSTNFSNVFINAGHGSRGLTTSLGSGKVLDAIMNGETIEGVDAKDYDINRFWLL